MTLERIEEKPDLPSQRFLLENQATCGWCGRYAILDHPGAKNFLPEGRLIIETRCSYCGVATRLTPKLGRDEREVLKR